MARTWKIFVDAAAEDFDCEPKRVCLGIDDEDAMAVIVESVVADGTSIFIIFDATGFGAETVITKEAPEWAGDWEVVE